MREGIVLGASLGIAMAFAACGTSPPSGFGAVDDAGTDAVPTVGIDSSIPGFSFDSGPGSPGAVQPTGPVTDFPQPVLDGTAPATSATLFGPTSQGASSGGPCLVEPENDVIYPQNWLRPRFTWTAA